MDEYTIEGQSDYWIDSMLADADQLRIGRAVTAQGPRRQNLVIRAARNLVAAFKSAYGVPARPSRREAE